MTLEDPIATHAIFPGFYNHAERRVPLRYTNPQDVSLVTYVAVGGGGGGVKANTQHTRVCYNKFNYPTLRPLLMTTLSLRGSNIFTRICQHWPFYVDVTYTILVNQILLYGVQVSRCVKLSPGYLCIAGLSEADPPGSG